MRALQWLLLVVSLLALIATGLYLRRDAAARYLANSALEGYGFHVASLTVDKLRPSTIALSQIVILERTGARYRITDVELKLSDSGKRLKRLAAGRLEIETGSSEGEPAAFGALVQSVVGLPVMLPGVNARLASLSINTLPELTDITWRSAESSQVIEFSLGDTRLTLSSAPTSDSQHAVRVTAITGAGDSVLAIDAVLRADADPQSIDGTALLQTTAWIPILKQFDLLPGELERFDARFRGDISIALDTPVSGQASIISAFTLLDQADATYRTSEDERLEILIDSLAPLRIKSTMPAGDWLLGTAQANGQVTAAGLGAVPFEASEVECRSETRCAITVTVEAADRRLSGLALANLSLIAPLVIEAGDPARIVIDRALQFSAESLSTKALSAERIGLTGFSGMTLTLAEGVWESTAATLGLALSGVNLDDAGIDAVALEFSQLRLGHEGLSTLLEVPPRSALSRGGLSAPLPGLKGSVSFRDERFDGAFSLRDSRSALSGTIEVSHRLDQRVGTAAVRDLTVDFKSARLSPYLDSLTPGLDIVDGALTGDLALDWKPSGDALAITGRMESALNSLSGSYENTAFVDLDTRITASLDAAGPLWVAPSRLTVALIDVGLPLRDFSADYTLDAAAQSVRVENLSVNALGGVISADPFDYVANADANSIRLHARSVPLQAVVAVAEIKNLEITGSISGTMPLTISGDGVRIDTGRLASDGRGGVIRYGAGRQSLDGVVPNSELSIVTRALSNFQYDSLVSNVEYADTGDLHLKMRLSGINPDMDATQPIILNLSIVNNVPQTLRSLRSIRSIEDILSKRTTTRPSRAK